MRLVLCLLLLAVILGCGHDYVYRPHPVPVADTTACDDKED